MNLDDLIAEVVAEHGWDVSFEFAENDTLIHVYKGDDIVATYKATPKDASPCVCPLCGAIDDDDDDDDDAYFRNQEAAHAAIEARLPEGVARMVYFSVDEPIETSPQVGYIQLEAEYDVVWDHIMRDQPGKKGKRYVSDVMVDPSWLDIALAANDMIRTTGDYTHFFLEGITHKYTLDNGVKVYQFLMGS